MTTRVSAAGVTRTDGPAVPTLVNAGDLRSSIDSAARRAESGAGDPFTVVVLRVERGDGAPSGQPALDAAARGIAGTLRATDCAGSIGPDELAVLLPRVATDSQAREAGARLARAAGDPALTGSSGQPHRVRFGVALCPGDGADAHALFARARLTVSVS